MMSRCEQCNGRIWPWQFDCNGRWHKKCWQAWKAARSRFQRIADDEVKQEQAEKGSIVELRKKVYSLGGELEKREEEETMRKGCHKCGGTIGEESYRQTVTIGSPCSEGSMAHTFNVCGTCVSKVWELMKPADDDKKGSLNEQVLKNINILGG